MRWRTSSRNSCSLLNVSGSCDGVGQRRVRPRRRSSRGRARIRRRNAPRCCGRSGAVARRSRNSGRVSSSRPSSRGWDRSPAVSGPDSPSAIAGTRVALVVVAAAHAEAVRRHVVGAERHVAEAGVLQPEVAVVELVGADPATDAERQRFGRHDVHLADEPVARAIREIVVAHRGCSPIWMSDASSEAGTAAVCRTRSARGSSATRSRPSRP